MRRTLAPAIVLILALAVHGCAKTDHKMNGQLGATRPVTSFPNITPVGADKFIFSDASNSWLFSAATLTDTKTALGIALDSSGFNKNLTTNDDTLQEIVDKFDGLVFAAAMGADDNYVTDAEKTVIGNTSGTNTGDQTTVSGNAGSATVLQTGRTIGGVSFNGSANISLPGVDTAGNQNTTGTAAGLSSSTADNQIYQATGSGTAAWSGTIEGLIDPTAGDGDTDKLWSADTVFDLLAGKQGADADLTTAAGASAASNSTVFGKNSSGQVGFWPGSSAGFALDTYPAYEDSPHSGSGIAENGTTVAIYSPTVGKWMTLGSLSDTFDPAAAAYSQDFEAGTQPAGWTATGTVLWNATPALAGTYSMGMVATNSIGIYTPASAMGTIYVTFLAKQAVVDSGTDMPILSFYNSTTYLGKAHTGNSGAFNSGTAGGTTSYGETGVFVSATPLWLKVRYSKGTGTDAIVTTWTSTDGYSDWTQRSSSEDGTSTSDCDNIQFYSNEYNTMTFDTVKVSATDITDAR